MKSVTLFLIATMLLIPLSGCGKPPAVSKKKSPTQPVRDHLIELVMTKSPLGEIKVVVEKTDPGVIDLATVKPALKIKMGMEDKESILITEEDLKEGFTRTFELPSGDYSVVIESGTPFQEGWTHWSRQYFAKIEQKAVAKPSVIPNLDTNRLVVPKGISKFWRRYNLSPPKTESVDEVLKTANDYISLDQNLGYYASGMWDVKSLCSLALARDGRSEDAIKVLSELQAHNHVSKRHLSNGHFDAIRENEEFQEFVEFSKSQTEWAGPNCVLLVNKPYCSLSDVLSIKTEPKLPSASDLEGQVVVVFTGPSLSENGLASNLQLWEKLKDVDVKKIAILGEKPAVDTGDLEVYIAESADQLLFAGASITWFADKEGKIEHARRNDLYASPDFAVSVIEFLQSR